MSIAAAPATVGTAGTITGSFTGSPHSTAKTISTTSSTPPAHGPEYDYEDLEQQQRGTRLPNPRPSQPPGKGTRFIAVVRWCWFWVPHTSCRLSWGHAPRLRRAVSKSGSAYSGRIFDLN
jgi:hypothetical protein